ncbi:hypothetical protein A3B42_03735 [Candidatus Daviesbacteria bacterium RIFCSPLOWO2_01_FULL_38_10]|uniref:Capsular polysaccharide biosynthesis protein n=1 Tax=Candidatus Daviesbacteria bacterium GW2011_GWF2_38_6 TaxID=1618432 RepID=A0A0G0KLC4_9BACT|nr:MAG: Capsular polysaccharide biosynthesis protein [Candidatus Daviesbacteria bacterium GW2011_GWF2_38_6]OGE27141.1 MAG: hypothetical protein A2772_02820 [Candidatus Daviesbacteria bacterium RIFCSPHIGHO2_01_FULL_38_8b]OGE37990.1 MAG: hypothetical protein A3B42_03735 [Candidatus Daviesbacteria bacterium RIFCSPLOWO2_01_FULL_38_10]OGE68706.1 MAG: hypothetical protein A3H81_00430 [Candidatus Daviesbacteria bacterium RIFCSPLOWO2_02_FULL_38_18]OGE72996.1 MAG: hypothetical protein A3H18_00315 [Candi
MKKISNLINNPLFTGSMVMIIGSNLVNFLNYLYHLIIGRMLGPSDYGELAAIISLIGLLGIIPAPLGTSIIKYISSAKNNTESANMISWLKIKYFQGSFIFFVIVLVISPVISSFLKIHNISYFILIAVSFLFSLQSGLNRSILQGLLRFKEMVITVLAENSTKLILSIGFVYLGFKVGGAIFALVVAALLGWYVTKQYLRYSKTRKPNFTPDIKSMLMFTIPVFIQNFATTSLYSSDVILVKHFFSSHDAGIYAALSTLGKIIFFAAGPIGAVMFPLVSKRSAKGENYKRVFKFSFVATVFLSGAILSVYLLFPSLAIQLLYGSLFLEASSLLLWFGIFITFFTLASLIINYTLSLGRTRVVIFPAIAAVFQIVLIWFFHDSLFSIILISILVNALLLVALLIYSIYSNNGHKANFSHSAGI